MRAKEWIQRINDNPHWGRVEIDWEAIEELTDLIIGSDLSAIGQAAIIGGLTVKDLKTLANLKHKGFMPLLDRIDFVGIIPEELAVVRWDPGKVTGRIDKVKK